MSTATQSKPRRKKAELPAGPDAASVSAETIGTREIQLTLIDRHPFNRVIRPEDVADLAVSIEDHGQREPLRVRVVGDRYQLLSGERRMTALKSLGRTHATCLVVKCDDSQALAEVAIGNAGRKDLDAIERAQLLEHLLRPIDEGGAGLDRLAAGRMFGLQSESGVKNAVRMLKLPPFVQDLVRTGELPERLARKLVPYCVNQAMIDAIDKDFRGSFSEDGYEKADTLSSLQAEAQPHWLFEIVREHSRPMHTEVQEHVAWDQPKRQRLFDPTPEQLEQLQVVQFPGDDRDCERALNVELWDRLNKPFAKAAKGKGDKKGDKKASKYATEEIVAPLTAKEKAAEAKRKAKEAEQRLTSLTREVAHRLLRCTLASSASQGACLQTLPGLLDAYGARVCGIEDMLEWETGSKAKTPKEAAHHTDSDDRLQILWERMLWPVSCQTKKRKLSKYSGFELTATGELPDRIQYLDDDYVRDLAVLCDVTIEQAWDAAANPDSDARRLVAAWLTRHTKEQLLALIQELGINEGDSVCKRDELVEIVLRHHRVGSTCSIPKRLTAANK